jgi:hypothetical protein
MNNDFKSETVYYSSDIKDIAHLPSWFSVNDWLGLIMHEHIHVQDIEKYGSVKFHSDYAYEWANKGYYDITTEKLAYKSGFDFRVNNDYSDRLLTYTFPGKGNTVMGVLQNTSLTTQEQENEMYKIGYSFRAHVIIQDEINNKSNKINSLLLLMTNIAPDHPNFSSFTKHLGELTNSINTLQQEQTRIDNFVNQIP